MKVMKYVPKVRVPAVISLSILFIPLLREVVPISSSFKNMLLFMPMSIPVRKDFLFNAEVITTFMIFGIILKFFITTNVDISKKKIHIIGTILFSIFVISLFLLFSKSVSSKNIIMLSKYGFIFSISLIVLVCIIRKKQEYVIINRNSIIILRGLFFSP